MSKFTKDLTDGNIMSNLIKFALPFVLSNFIQSLYNIADMFIVGRYIGKIGISAVGIGGSITFLMIIIGMSICMGASIIISQYIGAKEENNAKETISTLLTGLIIVSIIVSVLMYFLSDIVLNLLKTPAIAYTYSKQYLNITILGIIFIFVYNALSSIMRSMGNSKVPLYLISFSCFLNIVLDYIFIAKFNLGVRGVAIATVISQAFSVIACIVYLIKSDFLFDFKPSSFRIYKDKLSIINKTAYPILLQNVAMNFSFMAMTGLSNYLGVESSAALSIVSKFNGFAMLPTVAVASSVSTMVAQHIGANQIHKVPEIWKKGILVAYMISIPMFLAIYFNTEFLIKIFDKDIEVIRTGSNYLKYFSIDYLIVPIQNCTVTIFVGSGHTKISSSLAVFSALILRVPMAMLFVVFLNFGLGGVGLSAPIATGITTIIALILFKKGVWKKKILKNNL